MEQEKKEILKDLQACQRQLEEKNELLNQYREHLKQAKEESESNRKSILNLQNKLFESQIELSKSKDHQSWCKKQLIAAFLYLKHKGAIAISMIRSVVIK